MLPLSTPFARPLYVMLKPAGDRCNLACSYCYYTAKSGDAGGRQPFMSDELLHDFIRDYIAAQTTREVLFTWHGGEPLLRPLDFYRRAVAWQQQYAYGHLIDNCLQTNGTLLTEEWCRFLKEQGWLVGISIDGAQCFHDACRRSRGDAPSFDRVMRGIELLDKYGVEWNAMAVVNSLNVGYPLEFYRFFKSIGCHYIQFTPIVERVVRSPQGARLAHVDESEPCTLLSLSVTPQQWGDFLCAIFDEWVRTDVGTYFIQLFDATLANWVGEPPGLCSLASQCGHAAVMEWNGDLYSCDHYVFPPYKLGNLRDKTLVQMLYCDRQWQFGRDKSLRLPAQCRACDYLFACHGECPKNRFAYTETGEPGLNYLCAGYHRYFSHVAPYMEYMKNELLAGRAPANVMQVASHIGE